MVLLKNDGVFPAKPARVALYGVYSYAMIQGGNGAGWVNSPYVVSLAEGLENAGIKVDSKLRSLYEAYADFKMKDLKTNHVVKVHVGDPQMPELDLSESLIEASEPDSEIAIITIGRISGEGRDRIHNTEFLIQKEEIKLIKDVCEAYHSAGKKVAVVLNICGPVETASWKKYPDAILCAWLPGEEAGNSVADVITGKVNPSGRLPMTFPINYIDAKGAENFPYNFVSDRANESVVHPERRGLPLKDLAYTDYIEGIYVGYRYFCTEGKAVSYPFGYGLSYTSFEYSEPVVSIVGDKLTASVKVTNTGSLAGKEAVGLYIKAPLGSFKDKPSRELKEFGKTGLLQPGESETLSFSVPVRQLASFNSEKSRWESAKGGYTAYFGANSEKSEAEASFTLTSARNYPVSRACEPVVR